MTQERQPTEREIAEARTTQRKLARMTLENRVFQNLVGSGEVMAHQAEYGSRAVESADPLYNTAINSDEAKKIKDTIYERKRESGKRKGIYARPSVSDYDIEEAMREQVSASMILLPLKDLSEILRGIDSGVKAIPKELEAYVPAELNRKIAEAQARNPEREIEDIAKSALNEQEQKAYALYNGLSQAYTNLQQGFVI